MDYLEKPLPSGWEEFDVHRRREFLEGGSIIEGRIQRDKVCVLEIWCECFGRNKSDIRKADSIEINAILNRLSGWEKTKKTSRFGDYGMQRFYKRV